MRKLNHLLILLLLLGCSTVINAQDKKPATDLMRSNGRIYVVVAVMLAILAGLIIYLVRLDRKMTKLEKETH
jgi:Ca2+/Na+ antiporter